MANEIIKDNDLALDIENLTVHYEVDGDVIEAVNNISLRLKNGRTLGLVGETGAGKSSTALAILKWFPILPALSRAATLPFADTIS